MSLIEPQNLFTEVPKFVDEAKLHFHAFGIGDLLLDKPIAHVGIIAVNEDVFNEYRKAYEPVSLQYSEITSDGKTMIYYQIKEPINLSDSDSVGIVEITKAGPDEILTTEGLIDHLTIYEPDIKTVLQKIESAGLKPIIREHDDGSTVALEINEYLQEIRFASFQRNLHLKS